MELSPIRLIREDVKIWLVYAGYQRRFFGDFAQSSRVFLNIPGFDASQIVFEDAILTRRHLAMSDAISEYIRGHLPTMPLRDPLHYSPNPYLPKSANARTFAAEIGNIGRLFQQVKVGDVVMSPGHGQLDPFLIGEITADWSKNDDLVVAQLSNEIVPARRVRWINSIVTRRDFSPRTARYLVNRHAITPVNARFYQDIFDSIYPSYSWGNRSKVDLFGNGYAGNDPLQPYDAAKLLKYVMSAVFAYEDGNIQQFQSQGIDTAIANFYDETRVYELAQNFNSPGKFSLITKSGFAAVLVASGLMIATADPQASFDDQRSQVSAQIGGAMQGAGEQGAQLEVDNFLNSLEGGTWKPVQSTLGQAAKNTLDLSLDNSTEVARHKDELNAR